MAEQLPEIYSFLAAADLSTKQYYFVKFTAARTVNLCTAITDLAVGVLQDDPAAAGRPCGVAVYGTTKLVAAAAIAAGVRVAPTAASKAQTAVGTQFPRGFAITAAAGDTEIFECLLLAIGAAI